MENLVKITFQLHLHQQHMRQAWQWHCCTECNASNPAESDVLMADRNAVQKNVIIIFLLSNVAQYCACNSINAAQHCECNSINASQQCAYNSINSAKYCHVTALTQNRSHVTALMQHSTVHITALTQHSTVHVTTLMPESTYFYCVYLSCSVILVDSSLKIL